MKRRVISLIVAALCLVPVGASAWWQSVRQVAISTSGCTEATNFLARKSGSTNNADYTTYICGLVTDGVWAHLDALYIYAGDTQANSLLSLVSATYNGAIVAGPPVWTAGGGGVGGFNGSGGGNARVTTNFNPTTATSPKFVQNSSSAFFWNNTAANNPAPLFGYDLGATTGTTYIYTSGFWDVNGNAGYTISNGTSVTGLYGVVRDSSSNVIAYRNPAGSSVASGASTSSAPLNANLIFGGGDGNANIGQEYMMGGFGEKLTAGEITNLYTRTHTLLTAIAGIP